MDSSQGTKILFWTNFLGLLGLFSINIYLPSLPELIQYFHTTPAALNSSITLFLSAFSISQFFWGSLSERFGRKKPILWGLALSCIGAALSMVSTSVFWFVAGRLIEGTGIGCASALCRAVFTDSFKGLNLSRAISYFTTFANIMPALAPILGGYLMSWFSWRMIFLLLIVYAGGLFLVFWRVLPETHQHIRPKLSMREALFDYLDVVKSRGFWGYVLPYVLISGGMIAYYTASSPFWPACARRYFGFFQRSAWQAPLSP